MTAQEMMIMVAPNGARRTKADHPALPMTVAEMVADAVACHEAGASVLHLHVRDGRDGGHSLDPALYRQFIAAIRAKLGNRLVIQMTTEAMGMYTAHQQMEIVRELQPEAVSLAYRELFTHGCDEKEISAFLFWMARAGIWPQFIMYEEAELAAFINFYERGDCPFPAPFLMFVLGQYGRKDADPDDLEPFLDMLGGREWPWAVCAFGRREADCVLSAAEAGGHARVGFENNLWLPGGHLAPDNASLVRVAVQTCLAAGRKIMDVEDVRTHWKL